MNKFWLKFFTLFYGLIILIFHLSQIIIGRFVYLLIKPDSFLKTIFFIIVLLIACFIYYIVIRFLVNKIRFLIKPFDSFLIKIEEFDKEFQQKNKNY